MQFPSFIFFLSYKCFDFLKIQMRKSVVKFNGCIKSGKQILLFWHNIFSNKRLHVYLFLGFHNTNRLLRIPFFINTILQKQFTLTSLSSVYSLRYKRNMYTE